MWVCVCVCVFLGVWVCVSEVCVFVCEVRVCVWLQVPKEFPRIIFPRQCFGTRRIILAPAEFYYVSSCCSAFATSVISLSKLKCTLCLCVNRFFLFVFFRRPYHIYKLWTVKLNVRSLHICSPSHAFQTTPLPPSSPPPLPFLFLLAQLLYVFLSLSLSLSHFSHSHSFLFLYTSISFTGVNFKDRRRGENVMQMWFANCQCPLPPPSPAPAWLMSDVSKMKLEKKFLSPPPPPLLSFSIFSYTPKFSCPTSRYIFVRDWIS